MESQLIDRPRDRSAGTVGDRCELF